jgi:hypothetical protein
MLALLKDYFERGESDELLEFHQDIIEAHTDEPSTEG